MKLIYQLSLIMAAGFMCLTAPSCGGGGGGGGGYVSEDDKDAPKSMADTTLTMQLNNAQGDSIWRELGGNTVTASFLDDGIAEILIDGTHDDGTNYQLTASGTYTYSRTSSSKAKLALKNVTFRNANTGENVFIWNVDMTLEFENKVDLFATANESLKVVETGVLIDDFSARYQATLQRH